jgi:hypothetical protein
MSALTTHTSSQFREKRKKRKENERKKLKQVIKSQTKSKKRARHNRDKMLDPLRQGQRLYTTEINAPKLPTPQGEAKGLDTIGKRARLKFRRERAPKCMNASSP